MSESFVQKMLTPAQLKEPLHIVFFFINMFCGGLGTCITACLDQRTGAKFEAGHLVMGIIQCFTCGFWIGYPWALAWGTCFWLKGRGDLKPESRLGGV